MSMTQRGRRGGSDSSLRTPITARGNLAEGRTSGRLRTREQRGTCMEYHPVSGTVGPPEATMIFGACELTCTELQDGRRQDLLELLMDGGVKRLAAERILEIHHDGDPSPGRARSHTTSRASSSR